MLFTFNVTNVFAAKASVDSQQFKIIENNAKILTVMGEYQGDQLYATLDKKTKEITMKSVEKPKLNMIGIPLGKDIVHNYTVKVDRALKGEVSAIVTDNDSKKDYKISKKSDKVQAQAVIAIPLLEWLGASLLEYLLALFASIVIAGVTYIAVSSVLDDIENDSYDLYAAYTIPGDAVYIGGVLDYSDAVARLQMGYDGTGYNDVFAKYESYAYWVALDAGDGYEPVGPEIGSGSGDQYNHYHVFDRWYGTHSFFALWSW